MEFAPSGHPPFFSKRMIVRVPDPQIIRRGWLAGWPRTLLSLRLRRSFFFWPYNKGMALSWSNRRKVLYSTVIGLGCLIILVALYDSLFNQAPTCFDNTQNQNERGVDCGGPCALVCRADARAPVVLWSRTFEVTTGVYTAAAYVQNPNQGAAARAVPYTFQLFDEKNLLVTERQGVLDIPPVQTVPFIDPNINVGNRTVAKAIFSFTETPVWRKTVLEQRLRVSNQFLSKDASRLSATILNDGLKDAEDVLVAAVLFDSQGVARAASRSILAEIPRRGSQHVVFTWSGGVSDIVRAEITVLPSF